MIAFLKRNLVNAIIAGAVLVGLAYLGLTTALGAHPFWAVKIAYIGVGFGVVIYSLFWVWQGSWLAKMISFILLLAVSGGITTFGKTRFAASFAEDAMAGRLWYFGWIAVIGFAFALLFHLLSLRSQN